MIQLIPISCITGTKEATSMNRLFKKVLLCVCIWTCTTIAYSQQKNCISFQYDIGISGIKLENANSVTTALGKNSWSREFEKEDGFGMPRIEIINADKTQLLRLGFFEGDFENNVQAFQIQYLPANYKLSTKTAKINTPNFISTLHIKLGMTKAEIIAKIGKGYKTSKEKGLEKLKWYTNDPKSAFLKKYSAIGYSIECTFNASGQLSEYYFGFEYP